MSTGYLEANIERFEALGRGAGENIAICDMVHGELVACPGTVVCEEGDDFMPRWSAQSI